MSEPPRWQAVHEFWFPPGLDEADRGAHDAARQDDAHFTEDATHYYTRLVAPGASGWFRLTNLSWLQSKPDSSAR